MTEMIEKVARAMSAACYEETGSHQFIPSVWEHFARAAIEAMRYSDGWDEDNAIAVGRNMGSDPVIAAEFLDAWIDAALTDARGS